MQGFQPSTVAMENPPFVDVLSICPIGKSWISIAMFVHRRVSGVQMYPDYWMLHQPGLSSSPPTKLLNVKPSQKPANSSPSIVHLHLNSPKSTSSLSSQTPTTPNHFLVPQPFPIPFPTPTGLTDSFSQTLPWVWEGTNQLAPFPSSPIVTPRHC